MKREEKKERKVRSDKKVRINSMITPKTDSRVCEFVFCCRVPRYEVAEFFARAVLYDHDLLALRNSQRFEFEFDKTFILYGNLENWKYRKPKDANRELYAKVPQELADRIEQYAHALGGASSAATLERLVKWGTETPRIVAAFLRAHPPVDKVRMEWMMRKWEIWFPEKGRLLA